MKPPKTADSSVYIHYPIIKIHPRDLKCPKIQEPFHTLPRATHIIFTSQSTVPIFFEALKLYGINPLLLNKKKVIAVGEKTAQCLHLFGVKNLIIAKHASSEGVVETFNTIHWQQPTLFWPHSSLARPVIKQYFLKRHFSFQEAVLYDTKPHIPFPLPPPSAYDKILFTSPSTVDAFLHFFKLFPQDKELVAIGKITERHLKKKQLSLRAHP